MSSVVIDLGHVDYSSGAVAGGFREDFLNKSIGMYAVPELQRHGVNITVTTGILAHRVQVANSIGADMFVSVHNNAGGGDGTEVLYTSEKGKILAQNILDAIVGAGLNNSRGLKDRDNLYVLNNTKMPAALVECAFMDTSDIQAVDTEEERKAFGISIAKGILKTLGISYTNPTPPKPVESDQSSSSTETFWRVVTDSYRDKSNADKRVEELKSKFGINSFIVKYEK